MFLLSFINYDAFDNVSVCIVLWICVIVSQLSFLYNILGICIYRFLFILHTGKHRFGWKSNTTVVQLAICFIITIVYGSGTFFISERNGDNLSRCGKDELLGKNLKVVGIYLSTGLFAPLVCTDVLYMILFCKIRGISNRRKLCSQRSNSRKKKKRKRNSPASAFPKCARAQKPGLKTVND